MRSSRWLSLAFLAWLIAETSARAAAPTIHVLIVGDTDDPKIGQSVVVDVRNLEYLFSVSVPSENLQLERVTGSDVTRNQILGTIAKIRAHRTDGVVFLWSGHGAYDERGHFFHMPNQDRLYRGEVVAAVQRCGAGSDTVLSDCCNTFVPTGPPVAFAPVSPIRISPLMRSLFLDSHGLTDINGASEGEVGLCDTTHGGAFFWPLIAYCLSNGDSELSWNELVKALQPQIDSQFSQLAKGIQVESVRQQTQTLRVWHLSPGWPGNPRALRFGITVLEHRGDGVVVNTVDPDSPAEKAEVDPGDVILSVNGTKITNTQQLLDAVAQSPRAMKFTLRGARSRRVWDLEARLRD